MEERIKNMTPIWPTSSYCSSVGSSKDILDEYRNHVLLSEHEKQSKGGNGVSNRMLQNEQTKAKSIISTTALYLEATFSNITQRNDKLGQHVLAMMISTNLPAPGTFVHNLILLPGSYSEI